MANTTNLDLVKPAGTDKALVSVINANSDKIDAFAGTTNQALLNKQEYYPDAYSDLHAIPNRAKLVSGRWVGGTTANTPISNNQGGFLFFGSSDNYQTLVAMDNSGNLYTQGKVAGTWGSWQQLALKSDIDSIEGGVPVRRVGVIENNGSVSLRVSNQFSSNADFAIVCLNISGSATVGFAILALGKGTNKYKDLIGAMATSAYECSYSNGTWTITNKCGSDMFYTALVTRVG